MTHGTYWRCAKCHYAHVSDYCPKCGHDTIESEDFHPQPEVQQEPAAWLFLDDPTVYAYQGAGVHVGKEPPKDALNFIPLYTHPQHKQRHLLWPVRGVRVDGDKVIIMAKGGNDAARWLCGEILSMATDIKGKA